ncbi:MAG TPA: LCCL domain-containing protein, partial [Archangium sp.]|uniref:LCCL domain-containing protein n=1 Tax=Archangium sp. TaxID=1872627 RepID=UPI002ED8C342
EQAVADVARCLNDPRPCMEALSTREAACHGALEELACENSDSPDAQELLASALKEQLARAGAGRSDSESVTSMLASNCPVNLSAVTTGGSCYCPPLSSFGSIWGTGVYTIDSHLCTAAVHSGIISAGTGGNVTYTILPGRHAYCSSAQNGVTSGSYGSWNASYSVGGLELNMVLRESVSHTYNARNIAYDKHSTFTSGASCLVKPVQIVYVDYNQGDLLAVGGDGTQQVIDGNWLPGWDSYYPLSTTLTDCPSTCPR